MAFPADIAEPDQVRALIADATRAFGGLDALVSCAGIAEPAALSDPDSARWQHTIDINLSGAFYLAREAGMAMHAAGAGTIIFVGSELSFLGMPMTRRTALRRRASSASCVRWPWSSPRPSWSTPCVRVRPTRPLLHAEMQQFPDPQATFDAAIGRVPLRRAAQPQEIARAILYLAADATYATGTTLEIDGGLTCGSLLVT